MKDQMVHEALARAGIFEGIDRTAAESLTKRLQRHVFPRGHVVFVEGETGDRMYIITSGKVKIGCGATDGRESLITVLGASDVFGELALFDPGPRTSTVTTLTSMEALSMDRAVLHAWITDYPQVGEHLLRVLARRLRQTNNSVADLIFTDVPGRVAKKLLDLTRRFGVQADGELRLNHELTQLEIAQLVGSSRETVNKALIDFAQRGWIRSRGKTIWIIDSASLARRART